MSPQRAGRTLAAAAATALLLATAPTALAAESSISGKINPNKGKPGTPLRLTVNFTTEGDEGVESSTLRQVIVQLPPNAVQNAKFFPVCRAVTINAAKSFRNCPKNSQIGRGSLRADVPMTDVYNVPGTVTFFNGSRKGNRITIHVNALRPVPIYEAFDATLLRTRGRYGYKLIANIPDSLQEISPGWFAQVRRFTSTFNARIKVRGKTRGYIEAKRCPKARRVPIAGSFAFRQGSSTSALGWITCRP
ncbi:hypothetical protein [Conexibacter arvalis]|uniref:Uncharacterized protein n=1 Tax=Conexibacter arvalis TaxID=912552 RepID=A0A840IET5_9ACTN|nr:hypothetical protein [Conexibacter arvalis]MBB4662584.1 hypothetical protein [Conexibacter arvalis]